MEWIEHGSAPRRSAAPHGHWSRLRKRLAAVEEATPVTALFACPAFGAFLLAGPLRRSEATGLRLIGLQETAVASGAPARHLLDFAVGFDSHLEDSGRQLDALAITARTLVTAQFNSFGDPIHVLGFTVQGYADQLGVGRHIIRTGLHTGRSLISLRSADGPASLRTPLRNLVSWESTRYPGL